MKNIAVYCSSSDILHKDYFDVAEKTGKVIGDNGYTLIYGGGKTGLMGKVAESTHNNKGKVTGVFPKIFIDKDLAYEKADEFIITEDMYERKKTMAEKADAFIVLPGGFGTLEEVLDVITQKQLEIHKKPIVFINTRGYYNKLIEMFEVTYEENTAKTQHRDLYYVTDNIEDAFKHIKNYTPPILPQKWHLKAKLEK